MHPSSPLAGPRRRAAATLAGAALLVGAAAGAAVADSRDAHAGTSRPIAPSVVTDPTGDVTGGKTVPYRGSMDAQSVTFMRSHDPERVSIAVKVRNAVEPKRARQLVWIWLRDNDGNRYRIRVANNASVSYAVATGGTWRRVSGPDSDTTSVDTTSEEFRLAFDVDFIKGSRLTHARTTTTVVDRQDHTNRAKDQVDRARIYVGTADSNLPVNATY